LKLEYDVLLSNFGVKFDLRRYTMGTMPRALAMAAAEQAAGAYTRPLFGST